MAKTQICTSCGKEKGLNNYYYSSSPFHKLNQRLHVCKQCIGEITKELTKDDIDRVKNVLRMLDKPFLEKIWLSSIDEFEKRNSKDLFGVYMKNIGMKQYRDLTWDDSEVSSNVDNNKINVDHKELIEKWGYGYSKEDYLYLEKFYNEYENSYATDTPVQRNLYKNIAKVHLQAEKALASNNVREFKDLMELSSKLHNDGNIKPIQSTGAHDNKGLSTYGLWIKTIEEEEPCEYFKNKPIYEDYDGFKKYWQKWFVRPFKNIFNLSRDFNVDD